MLNADFNSFRRMASCARRGCYDRLGVLQVVETTADVTAPAFKPGFPRVSNIAPEEFTVEAHISEAGLVHYLLLPIDAPAPSVFQVLVRDDAGDWALLSVVTTECS